MHPLVPALSSGHTFPASSAFACQESAGIAAALLEELSSLKKGETSAEVTEGAEAQNHWIIVAQLGPVTCVSCCVERHLGP